MGNKVHNDGGGVEDKGIGGEEAGDTSPAVSIGELFRYATALDGLLMFLGFLGEAVVGSAQAIMMILLGELFDLVGAPPGTKSLEEMATEIVLKFAYVAAACFVGGYLGSVGFKVPGLRQSAQWRKTYLTSILRQDIGWFDVNKASELSSLVASETTLIEDATGTKLSMGVRALAQAVSGLVVGFYFSWDVALVSLAASPIGAYGAYLMATASTRGAKEVADAYAKAGSTASETLSELRTVAALGCEKHQAQKYAGSLEVSRAAGVTKGIWAGFSNGMMFGAGNMTTAFSFLYAGWKLSQQLKGSEVTTKGKFPNPMKPEKCGICLPSCSSDAEMAAACAGCCLYPNCMWYDVPNDPENFANLVDPCETSGGKIIVAVFTIMQGTQAFGMMEPTMSALSKARAAVWKILQVVDRTVPIDSMSEKGSTLPNVQGTIKFDNVHFAYPSRPDQKVCQGYNLVVESGTTVALVGASGSGKSTAVSLVERFYDPDSGSVTLDGTDLKELNVRWLREQIGLVGQEPVLFSGTIADNISSGKPGSTREQVETAAKMANAHAFIMEFPEGYDTNVGEKGGQLSGGQKQRVAIARAMIKNPKVLLLDEATSALDNESEKVVQAALDDLMNEHKRTTIVIAHRLTTIRNADKIAVVDKGRIVEEGNHDQLMAKGPDGFYFKLYNAGAGAVSDTSRAGVVDATAAITSSDDAVGSRDAPSVVGVKTSGLPECSQTGGDKNDKDMTEEEKAKKKVEEKLEAAKNKANLSRLWGLLEGAAFPFFVGTIGAMIVGVANPLIGLLFIKIMSPLFSVDHAEVWDTAMLMSAAMFSLSLLQIVGDTCRGWGFCVPGERLTVKLRIMFYDALVRQEIGWHDLPENSSGTLCASLATEVTTIHAMMGESLGKSVAFVFTVVTGFVLAFTCGYWEVALWALLMVPILGGTMAFEIAMIQGSATGQESGGLSGDAGKIVGQAISSVRTVASFTMERAMTRSFVEATDAYLKSSEVKAAGTSVLSGLSQGMLIGAFAFMYWQGSRLAADDQKDLPIGAATPLEAMIAPIFVFFLMAAGLGQAFNGATDTSKASSAAGRVFEAVDRQSKIDFTSDDGLRPATVTGTIKFDNVHFAYPSRPDQKVCQGYNLVVESGTTVALVGASGSGKSTAVSLVERFYDPDSGSVTLDGTDLKELNVRWLREQIGLVGQEPVLFSGTIADNISSGKPGSTREQVETAAKMANAHAFIMEFPEGYDTNVGEKGGQLSGGQKQRVAIARAMIKNPKVLLLDEATSALDNESEKVVQAALDDLMNEHKRTTIVIAHRLTTIRNADKIAVVDKGRIVEEGNHDQLMAKGPDGFYFKLNSSLPSSSSTDSLGRTALAAYAAVHMQGQHN